jgi:hypothetical protein
VVRDVLLKNIARIQPGEYLRELLRNLDWKGNASDCFTDIQ